MVFLIDISKVSLVFIKLWWTDLLFVGEKTVILMKQTCALYLWLLNADIW